MTAIAYDGMTLAADSRLTSCNNAPAGEIDKAWRTNDGSRWAHSGAGRDNGRLRAWTTGSRADDPPDLEEGVLVHITPSGLVREWWGKSWIEARARFYAWGSGERIAKGAMMAGALATVAVSIACELDPDCGGAIIGLGPNTTPCA